MLGMMKHADGSLLKPILPPPRGQRELNFYKEAFEHNGDELFVILKPLLPEFRGVFTIEAEDKGIQFVERAVNPSYCKMLKKLQFAKHQKN